jgi:phage gp16-like protein
MPEDNKAVRRCELAKLHIAPKELGMDDDVRKELIGRISKGRTRSCADLTAKERQSLLAEFIRLGWQSKVRGVSAPPAPIPQQRTKQAEYLRRLWKDAVKAGKAHHAEMKALQAFVCSVNRLALCVMPNAGLTPFSPAEISRAIEAVKSMIQR